MNIDERLEALTMNLELESRNIQDLRILVQDLRVAVETDADNIRALARIAEIHEHRIEHLEGDVN